MQLRLFDKFSYIIAAIAFVLSFMIVYSDTAEFWGSLLAAILTGSLVWLGYVLMRWLILASHD